MRYILIALLALFFVSCEQEKTPMKITNSEDYEKYLKVDTIKTTSKYFELWNTKIKPDSMQLTSFGIVASEYTRFFKETGNISFLKDAERALKRAVTIAAVGRADYYRALSRNYISQHRFKDALVWAEKAEKLGGGERNSWGLLFDVHMELGNFDIAHTYLNRLYSTNDFNYLIRAAKWYDHKGDLDRAIQLMEKAQVKAEMMNNATLKIWSYTNLADFYGHAGRIGESYDHYLKALKIDANNAYAKKGIAWIVFSHEKNAQEAQRILDAVTEVNRTPDYSLLKAEIAAFERKESRANEFLNEFHDAMKDADYGQMYTSHMVDFHIDVTRETDLALQLAKKEVENRATPETYGLLAYAHLKNNNVSEALNVIKTKVEGHTCEPKTLLQMAEIYKANGVMEKVESLKEELEGAAYEMGPSFPEILQRL